jgi:hypothetical protein
MTFSTASQPIFVGRQREMAELNALLDDSLSGHGQMAMWEVNPALAKPVLPANWPTTPRA